MHRRDAKYAVQVVLIYFFEGCKDLRDRAVCEMIYRSETDFLTYSQKEWNLIYKKCLVLRKLPCVASVCT